MLDGQRGLHFVPSDGRGDVSLTWMLPSAPSFSGVHHPYYTWAPQLALQADQEPCKNCPPANAFFGKRLPGSQGRPRGNAEHTPHTHHPAPQGAQPGGVFLPPCIPSSTLFQGRFGTSSKCRLSMIQVSISPSIKKIVRNSFSF